ncbi:hypothetical protein LCGC14_0881680 [marine sediment metagenome]|uniref:Chemoreceptor glutamine deamidase CheD n=1 Tax=marine sediment metagenome TaxID=412755 RepID=A0A0F9S8N8_9ZZZZ|nr:hypothetical protein [archaeon]
MTDNLNFDRFELSNDRGEIILPIGHYALINGKSDKKDEFPTISIYGLGSCIALILFDEKNRLSGMSHVLLPKSNHKKIITYPHKYADLTVQYLIRELMDRGAQKELIKAIIVGGSKIFDLVNNIIGEENIKIIMDELDKYGIKIIKKSIGGMQGRIIKFNTRNFTVLVKLSGDNKFQEL